MLDNYKAYSDHYETNGYEDHSLLEEYNQSLKELINKIQSMSNTIQMNPNGPSSTSTTAIKPIAATNVSDKAVTSQSEVISIQQLKIGFEAFAT